MSEARCTVFWYKIRFVTALRNGECSLLAASEEDAAIRFRRDMPWWRNADLTVVQLIGSPQPLPR